MINGLEKNNEKTDVYTHVSKVITHRISARLLWFVSWLALHVWVSKIEPIISIFSMSPIIKTLTRINVHFHSSPLKSHCTYYLFSYPSVNTFLFITRHTVCILKKGR